MRTSATGRALIQAREGRRLSAYRDTAGVLTIGVGHTGRMSPPAVVENMTISEAECDTLLARDLAPVEAAVASAVKVPLSQNEFDALVSLGFNIGVPALRCSSVVAHINRGDMEAAANAFLLWSKPSELRSRRRAERLQFLTPEAAMNGDASASSHLSSARGAVLATLAQGATRRASVARASAGALVLTGAASATQAAHHPHAWLLTGCAVLLALAAVLAAMVCGRTATTLLANAAQHLKLPTDSGTAKSSISSSK